MFKRPRGTRDFGPDEMRMRRWAEEKMRAAALKRGFEEIQMPIFEELKLFTTKSGVGIIDELYAFRDKGDREIALRPEMTAQVMRFYVSDLAVQPKPLKIFYYGPCFRYENPQSGRFREFFQFGAEVIGRSTSETDAEGISLAVSSIEAIGLENFVVRIGYIRILKRMMKETGLSDEKISEGLHFLDKNDEKQFRKFADDNGIPAETIDRMMRIRNLRGGIEILDQIEEGDADYLCELIRYLSYLGLKEYELDLGIVRGLDYYDGMVFEIDAPSLGAEKQICGGGSYDLAPLFGGEHVFTTGFAIGFDRALMAVEKEGDVGIERSLDAYVIPIGDGTREKALEIVTLLRKSGLSADFDIMRRSLSKNLKYAASANAKKAVILGERELAKGAVTIRDMASGEQQEIDIGSIIEAIG